MQQSFRPDSVDTGPENAFLNKEGSDSLPDALSNVFLEGKQTSREGSLEESFLRDADRARGSLNTETFERSSEHLPSEIQEARSSETQIAQNRADGCRRENEVSNSLANEFPESAGYKVLSERYLLDRNGGFARDPETGKCRRIDFIVVDGDGRACRSLEVTSLAAPKDAQSDKEDRIRGAGGTFIRDPESQLLIDITHIPTEIIRLP